MFVATQGALCNCTFGEIPTIVNPLPKTVLCSGMMPVTITDFLPIVNIPTFGLCKAPTNPAVAAIIIATLGNVKTVPCVPQVSTPWIPTKPTVLVNGIPICSMGNLCVCKWLGQIIILSSVQFSVM